MRLGFYLLLFSPVHSYGNSLLLRDAVDLVGGGQVADQTLTDIPKVKLFFGENVSVKILFLTHLHQGIDPTNSIISKVRRKMTMIQKFLLVAVALSSTREEPRRKNHLSRT